MKTDIEIAREAVMLPIEEVAKKALFPRKYLDLYGDYKAKIHLEQYEESLSNPDGKLILVTAINPTKAGEGKTTTSIGLMDGLAAIGKRVIGALREPSLGPVFGLKGGATGGGYAQVTPMEDINLHFTGDMHAITTVNNLISAVLDNSLFQGNPLNIDPTQVVWKRCMDMNDRALRDIEIGEGEKNGIKRVDHFLITVASEVMAIFCLSKSVTDFQEKVERVIVAYTHEGTPVTVKDLGISGALALLIKDALKPNLVQTLENNPVLIHGGPFANIAHGCNSILATRLALKMADYVVTEAGFGADLGAEKFLDIKCRIAGLKPSAIVLVATIRALKLHGGALYADLKEENTPALLAGIENLKKHIETLEGFGIPFVIALNRFESDTPAELEAILSWCKQHQYPISLCEGWAKGSAGTKDLAQKVVDLCQQESTLHYTYDLNDSIEDKLTAITRKIYGGSGIELSEKAKIQLKKLEESGYGSLPVCVAKTPLSLSDDPKLPGRPKDFLLHVKELTVSAGAGFIVALAGSIMTMPGLPKHPAALDMGIDEEGNAYGIF